MTRTLSTFQTDLGIANGAEILTPSANPDGTWPLDMTGYKDLVIAIKPTNAGNYRIEAIMGPDTVSYANLSPVNAAAILRGTINAVAEKTDFEALLVDAAESLTADVWNIFYIGNRLRNQNYLQF